MAITSVNKPKIIDRFRSTHFRYAITYIVITFVVLLFLNLYSSKVSQDLFFYSKETSMIEKCQLAASEISSEEIMNVSTVSNVVKQMGSLRVTRLVITDRSGMAIYDSASESQVGRYMMLPEIVQALDCNDVFS